MATHGRMRSVLRQILGDPEFSCRIPAHPAFTLERYLAMLEVAEFPPLPEPLLFVHTGGKAFSYRAGLAMTDGRSLPGLVTLVPGALHGLDAASPRTFGIRPDRLVVPNGTEIAQSIIVPIQDGVRFP